VAIYDIEPALVRDTNRRAYTVNHFQSIVFYTWLRKAGLGQGLLHIRSQ